MPYKSLAQQRFLHSQKPDVAKRFDAHIKALERRKKRKKGV